jgi:subfamily B ATP-binding cassette protein MsbA
MQDNFLFDGTVAENIAFSKPHATREEIQAVSRIAHVEEFVEKFELKYDTVVGERGVKLSGGQRQRIAIARAILADQNGDPVRSTSSLDMRKAKRWGFRTGLAQLRRRAHYLVNAHRCPPFASAIKILC